MVHPSEPFFIFRIADVFYAKPASPSFRCSISLLHNMQSNHRGDDDLLYGDLEDAAIAEPSSSNTIALTMTELEIKQLRQQLQSLKSENDILKQNMGILYRTAKSELDRKDRTILELQSELDSLRR
jgi:hypothetical protein